MRVSVIGGSSVTDEEYEIAREVGEQLTERGHTVVCGGLTGVMEAVAQGAREAGGHTIGIVPGTDPGEANEYVDTVITTGLGHARNVLVVLNGDAVIAIDGESGTLSEIGHAMNFDRPIAGIGTIEVPGVVQEPSPSHAIDYIESAVDAE